jgi:vacuolar-type H+-ATPase subunit I/STV1
MSGSTDHSLILGWIVVFFWVGVFADAAGLYDFYGLVSTIFTVLFWVVAIGVVLFLLAAFVLSSEESSSNNSGTITSRRSYSTNNKRTQNKRNKRKKSVAHSVSGDSNSDMKADRFGQLKEN